MARSSIGTMQVTKEAMRRLQAGPLAGYMPYTKRTEGVLRSLAELKPDTLAVMHGSSYRGPAGQLLTEPAEHARLERAARHPQRARAHLGASVAVP